MNILLVNDDGYNSDGILALRDALLKLDFVNIKLVAPYREQSASSHSLSIHSPLKSIKIDNDYYAIDDGKPADCVFIAINEIYKNTKIDLVISGINHGCNIGEDISYSGTIGASIEAVLYNIPSISISQFYNNSKNISFDSASKVIQDIVQRIYNNHFPLDNRRLLNINIPDVSFDKLDGYEITKCGYKIYDKFAKVHTNHTPRKEPYFWLGLNHIEFEENTDDIISDYEALKNNKVSITPIKVDMSDISQINHLKKWITK
jgi:5'-nucleotidase